jgi:hypothetical protein
MAPARMRLAERPIDGVVGCRPGRAVFARRFTRASRTPGWRRGRRFVRASLQRKRGGVRSELVHGGYSFARLGWHSHRTACSALVEPPARRFRLKPTCGDALWVEERGRARGIISGRFRWLDPILPG